MIHVRAKFQVEQKFVQREIKKTHLACYQVECIIHQDPQTRIYSYVDLSFLFLHVQIFVESETFLQHSSLHHVPIHIFG